MSAVNLSKTVSAARSEVMSVQEPLEKSIVTCVLAEPKATMNRAVATGSGRFRPLVRYSEKVAFASLT
jgi:hypothetical protein